MPRRRLDPEEEALWQAVARSATPLHPAADRPTPGPAPAPPPPAAPEAQPAPPLPRFRIGETARPAPPAQRPAGEPLRMDARTFARMTRGRLSPEARIDLHGRTLAEAHGDLIGFVLRAHAAGHRLVLVITGKGRGEDGAGLPHRRPGALRREVPHWLRMPPLAAVVQQVAPAHARHGGGGALYVYLRRPG
jgi:DNA-nicking Smr family endonuclease